MNCCFCGPVKNCGKYLPKVLSNIEQLGKLFENYKIFIYYDNSFDNSLQILKNYQIKHPDKLTIHINEKFHSPFRTHRLAYGRNKCLEYIRNNNENTINNANNTNNTNNIFDYFIMMDFDDVNCKNVNPQILKKYLIEPQFKNIWDALSFNTYPAYYDIWALSIYPYCFSYNHFTNNRYHNYHTIQNYIMMRLQNLKKEDNNLLRCLSSFNGFAIYRTPKFLNCNYDGRVRLDLIPKNYLARNIQVNKSNLVFRPYGTEESIEEDCEHRAFHMESINKNGARIRISPEILF